jgi:hypothetical protein
MWVAAMPTEYHPNDSAKVCARLRIFRKGVGDTGENDGKTSTGTGYNEECAAASEPSKLDWTF